MAKELEELRVTKADNGGHTVRHEFKRQPVKREGSMHGGIYSERPPSEEHTFGPGDKAAVLSHISNALGLPHGKGAAAAEVED